MDRNSMAIFVTVLGRVMRRMRLSRDRAIFLLIVIRFSASEAIAEPRAVDDVSVSSSRSTGPINIGHTPSWGLLCVPVPFRGLQDPIRSDNPVKRNRQSD